MEIEFHCFRCGRKLSVQGVEPGAAVNCPACNTSLVVPEPAPVVRVSRRRVSRRSIVIGVVLLLPLLVWSYFTPHLVVRDMMDAAEAKDADRFSRHVDYPAVRMSLKAHLKTSMMNQAKENTNPFEALGAGLSMMFTDTIVDALVSPEVLSAMMNGESMETNVPPTTADAERMEMETSMGYRGLNMFVVLMREKGSVEEPMEFVFQRSGLASWQLKGLRMPLGDPPSRGFGAARE